VVSVIISLIQELGTQKGLSYFHAFFLNKKALLIALLSHLEASSVGWSP
jgi:hypothetical protein